MLRHAARDGIVASARRAAYARVPPCAPNASFGAFASTSWSAATSSVTSACSLAASAARRAASSAGSTSAVTSVSPFFPSLRPRRMSTAPGGSGAPNPTPDPSRLGSDTAAAARRAAARRRVMEETARARGSASTGGLYLLALTVGMVGVTYASVPLYRMFCQATGFGGTTRRRSVEEKLAHASALPASVRDAAKNREVTVSFNADVAEGMPWRFVPTQKSVRVRPGETTLAFFTARNKSTRDVTGVATYNVQPNKAGSHFNKVQCFCFEEQRLRAGEEVDMPVFFYLDPEFASDPAMADVNDIILSYTFFRSDDFDETEEAAAGTGAGGVRVHGSGAVPPGIKPYAER